MNIQELLQSMEYPGRFIILGCVKENFFAIYGVTARNISSKAKRYVYYPEKSFVTVEATDQDVMAQGDLDLLQYNSVYFFDDGLVVGNGRQTDEIKILDTESASDQLAQDLQNQSFEPDKYNTPRITGCFLHKNGTVSAALHIIRSTQTGESVRDTYTLTLEPGKGKFISTYNGPNTRPTPSFEGEPKEIELPIENIQDFVKTIYDALSPTSSREDLRVSVVGVGLSFDLKEREVKIINSVDASDLLRLT